MPVHRIATLFAIVFVSVFVAGGVQAFGQGAQSAVTAEEIRKAFVGRTAVLGDGTEATYGEDGSYRFVGYGGRTSTGRYTISDGMICKTFTPQGSRCDRIAKQGNTYIQVNMTNGAFFSIRFK